MALGNFLDKLKGNNTEAPKLYLALVLTDQLVQSAVWKVLEGKTEIVSLGTPVEWDGEVATTNELIQAVDATISSATEGVEPEPTEIILGLANSWAADSGIKGSKKDLIRSICKELVLKPLGYVVLSNCLVRYLKMQEGAPPTSILIQVDQREVSLSLVRLGRIESSVTLPATANIAADVAEGISRFATTENLPSRFVVVSGMENTSELVQSLTAYDWQESFAFLHTPKIEALPKDVEVHATAVAGGSEVAAALGFNLEIAEPDPTPITPTTLPPALEVLSADQVGFGPVTLESLAPPVVPQQVKEDEIEAVELQEEDEDVVEDEPQAESVVIPKKSFTIPKVAFKLPSLPKLPHFGRFARLPIFAIGAVVLALAASVFGYLYLVPRAKVTLSVMTRPVEEMVDLTLSDKASSIDVANKTIPAKRSTQSISGNYSVPVSGTKTIGDPSRGEITIYNRTSLPKTLLKGTNITSGSVKFTLDSDATIASKSAGADYVDVPGKATVKITAASFGDTGNLKSGSEFIISTFAKDSFVGKNDAALTGGNSKEIAVVAATDKTTLVKELTSQLVKELKQNLALDATSTQEYFILENDYKISSEEYSAKVGEEAENLSGKLTLDLGVLTYDTADIQSLLAETIQQAIPSGYTKSDLPPTIELASSEVTEDQQVKAKIKLSIYLLPTVDTLNLASILKGKSKTAATTILDSIPNVTGSDISISPLNLPPRLGFLPLNSKNITFLLTPTVK